MAYSPLAVANEFIRLAISEGKEGLEHLKLQKLVHFVHGYSLRDGDSIVNENPQVWKLGPVFPSLYHELKYHGSEPIGRLERESDFGTAPVVDPSDTRARSTIQKVWRKYKNYTAFQLSDLTHKQGTPWYDAVVAHGGKVPMALELDPQQVKQHYQQLPELV